jgi:hypothetical protein
MPVHQQIWQSFCFLAVKSEMSWNVSAIASHNLLFGDFPRMAEKPLARLS